MNHLPNGQIILLCSKLCHSQLGTLSGSASLFRIPRIILCDSVIDVILKTQNETFPSLHKCKSLLWPTCPSPLCSNLLQPYGKWPVKNIWKGWSSTWKVRFGTNSCGNISNRSQNIIKSFWFLLVRVAMGGFCLYNLSFLYLTLNCRNAGCCLFLVFFVDFRGGI